MNIKWTYTKDGMPPHEYADCFVLCKDLAQQAFTTTALYYKNGFFKEFTENKRQFDMPIETIAWIVIPDLPEILQDLNSKR